MAAREDNTLVFAQGVTIDEEFQGLLPALDGETYRLLEESILLNGCHAPLKTWNGLLIDGYNRYRICMEHNIPYKVTVMEFGSREEAIIWIIDDLVTKRNLTPIQLSFFRGLHYRAERQLVSNVGGKNQHSEVVGQKVPQPHTADRLAERYKVNAKTINRDARLANAIVSIGEVSKQAKEKILSCEVTINKKKLIELSSGSQEEIDSIAAEIENGTYKRRSATVTSSTTAVTAQPISSAATSPTASAASTQPESPASAAASAPSASPVSTSTLPEGWNTTVPYPTGPSAPDDSNPYPIGAIPYPTDNPSGPSGAGVAYPSPTEGITPGLYGAPFSAAANTRLNMVLRTMIQNFQSTLQKLSQSGMQEFHTIIRSYINTLEDLYSSN